MPGLKERAKTLVELLEGATFLFAERPLAIDEKAQGAFSLEGRTSHGGDLLPRFERLSGLDGAQGLEAEVRAYVAEAGKVKLGQRGPAVARGADGTLRSRRAFSTSSRCWAATKASPVCGIRRPDSGS